MEGVKGGRQGSVIKVVGVRGSNAKVQVVEGGLSDFAAFVEEGKKEEKYGIFDGWRVGI